MKLWIDDCRPAPRGYLHAYSVEQAKELIQLCEIADGNTWTLGPSKWAIELIDTDHDAGDYASDGGDYIKLLDWLEATNRNYPIRIQSQNVVGRVNMRAIIERNGWKEIR